MMNSHVSRITELLGYGLSVREIAKVLGYTSHIALNTYINKQWTTASGGQHYRSDSIQCDHF